MIRGDRNTQDRQKPRKRCSPGERSERPCHVPCTPSPTRRILVCQSRRSGSRARPLFYHPSPAAPGQRCPVFIPGGRPRDRSTAAHASFPNSSRNRDPLIRVVPYVPGIAPRRNMSLDTRARTGSPSRPSRSARTGRGISTTQTTRSVQESRDTRTRGGVAPGCIFHTCRDLSVCFSVLRFCHGPKRPIS